MKLCPLLVALVFGAPLLAAEPAAPGPIVPTVDNQPRGFPATLVAPKEEAALLLDATAKEIKVRLGEMNAIFTFHLKNISPAEVVIIQVRTSCGCTVAKIPSHPWKLAPGAEGAFEIDVDLRGKTGVLVKTATIDTLTGFKVLTLKVTIPGGATGDPSSEQTRAANAKLALADRQAVFKGDCAACHAAPTAGQFGEALYLTACAVCHDTEHRASMVPDLHALPHPTDREFWRQIVTDGKVGTLMPAFALQQGGPLNRDQISSLAAYLEQKYSPPHPPASPKK